MNPIIFVRRPGRCLSMDKFLYGLDNRPWVPGGGARWTVRSAGERDWGRRGSELGPDEKAMIEDEDFEEEASESSSLHELSSVSGSGSDSSSLTKGSSSVVADSSGEEPLAIQPAACLPCTSSQERCGCTWFSVFVKIIFCHQVICGKRWTSTDPVRIPHLQSQPAHIRRISRTQRLKISRRGSETLVFDLVCFSGVVLFLQNSDLR